MQYYVTHLYSLVWSSLFSSYSVYVIDRVEELTLHQDQWQIRLEICMKWTRQDLTCDKTYDNTNNIRTIVIFCDWLVLL